jgi:predicted phage tail protein
MNRDEEGRLAAEGNPVRSTPRSWGARSGGLAGIAFVLLIIASWFADTTGFEDSDQTAGVTAHMGGGLD